MSFEPSSSWRKKYSLQLCTETIPIASQARNLHTTVKRTEETEEQQISYNNDPACSKRLPRITLAGKMHQIQPVSERSPVAHMKLCVVWGTLVPQSPVGRGPWPAGDIRPPDTAARTDAAAPASFPADTLGSFQFLGCILFSTCSRSLVQCFPFYGRTNAQHVSCSRFIRIFTVSSLTLRWFWLQLLPLPGHCPQGRVTAPVLIPILLLTTQFYCRNILLLLHCKPDFKIISKVASSVLKENTHLFIIFMLSFEYTFQWCSKDVFKYLAGQGFDVYLLMSVSQHHQSTDGWSDTRYRNSCWKALEQITENSTGASKGSTRWQDTGGTDLLKPTLSLTDLIFFANTARGNESCGQRRSNISLF